MPKYEEKRAHNCTFLEDKITFDTIVTNVTNTEFFRSNPFCFFALAGTTLYSGMNDKQKILLMVFVMSVAILISTAFYYSDGTFDLTGNRNIFGRVSGGLDAGIDLDKNWLGFIALGNICASLVGIFIFGDDE